MNFPANPAVTLTSKVEGRVTSALDFLFKERHCTTAQLKRAMGVNCDPSCYLLAAMNAGKIRRSGNRWEFVDAPAAVEVPPPVVKPKVVAPAAPAESPNTCRSESQSEQVTPNSGERGSANGGIGETPGPGKAEAPGDTSATEPGGPAQEGKADTPEPIQLEAAPQDTPPSGHPAASEKVETPETLPSGKGKTGLAEQNATPVGKAGNPGLEKAAPEAVPQEAAPIEYPTDALPSLSGLVDVPRDPALDWVKTGPAELRAAPKTMQPARFLYDEDGEYVLRRGFQEFSLTRDEAARFAQFWISIRDAVPA